MGQYYATRFTVRTTVELKGAYLGLCEARGVVASDEIRDFMASEVSKALQDTRPQKVIETATAKVAEGRKAEKLNKCANTADMFER